MDDEDAIFFNALTALPDLLDAPLPPSDDIQYEEIQLKSIVDDDPCVQNIPCDGGLYHCGAYENVMSYNSNVCPPSLSPPHFESYHSFQVDTGDVYGIVDEDEEARRRQKTCRVCGDHATGYNFNVITCESCKAFFRRNALRPKEFKCPYSEDCEINAVSRRFCQKCRLRKCFAVGMKKEWILNEEQLRRRKNSRLNNMTSQHRGRCDITKSHTMVSTSMGNAAASALKGLSSPMSLLQLHSPTGRMPMMSPTGPHSFPLLSPTDSSNSDSPPGTRGLPFHSQPSPEYEPSLMLQQRLAAARAATAAAAVAASGGPLGSPPGGPIRPSPRVAVDPVRNQVVMSMEEYHNLMQLAASTSSAVSPVNAHIPDHGSPEYKPNVFSPAMSISSPLANGGVSYADLNPMNGKADLDEKLKNYLDSTISDEMAMGDSPDISGVMRRGTMEEEMNNASERINYQLNTAELRALDVVREAFSGMNDPLDAGRQRESFMKSDKTPADIMNIMDVTMRRLVKMAKKVPTFNELSNEGKFALLKGGMVEMLTVRGVTRFDSSSNSWTTPVVPSQYAVSVNMFDQLNMANRDIQKSRFLQFVSALHEDLRKNELAINLIMLIVLFTVRDNIQNPSDRLLIEKHNREYVCLLNRYLESLYGEDARKFQEILPKALSLLQLISSNAVTLFLGTVKPEEAEPLPREFFKTD